VVHPAPLFRLLASRSNRTFLTPGPSTLSDEATEGQLVVGRALSEKRLFVAAALVVVLAACGGGPDYVGPAGHDEALAVAAVPKAGSAAEPGSDGDPGAEPGGGAGGTVGSASSQVTRGGGGLECSGPLAWGTGHHPPTITASNAYLAPKTPREALQHALSGKSESYRAKLTSFTFRRVPTRPPHASGKTVRFAGTADDGTVQYLVTVVQVNMNRWFPLTQQGCASGSGRGPTSTGP
jgi:hypothetical protein